MILIILVHWKAQGAGRRAQGARGKGQGARRGAEGARGEVYGWKLETPDLSPGSYTTAAAVVLDKEDLSQLRWSSGS
jgi:hypothetical protein